MSKVIVYHQGYGCDTGCCGHVVELECDDRERFTFEHPDDGEDPKDFARRLITAELGPKHVADLDWENIFVLDLSRC